MFNAQVANSQDLKTRVIAALEHPDYDWRTVNGIATEVREPEARVLEILTPLGDIIVRSADGTGRSIFTTRKHYDETHGFGDKLLSALADKVVA